MQVDRNDLCPCGSRKKFKDCCGSNVVAISSFLESEISEIQNQIIDYGLTRYGDEIESYLVEVMEELPLEAESHEFLTMIYTIWIILFEKMEDNQTIIESFIAEKETYMIRPRLQRILESWTSPVILAGRLERFEGCYGTLVTTIEEKKYEIELIDVIPESDKSYILGMAVPYEEKYVFYPMPLEFDNVNHEDLEAFLDDVFLESGCFSEQEFLIENFFDLMKTIPIMGQELDIKLLNLGNPVYEEVLSIFKKKMEETGEKIKLINAGISCWGAYCEHHKKRIKNPSIYAAALHYLINVNFDSIQPLTQKDIAGLYGVSHSSISSIYADLSNFLEEISKEDDMGVEDYLDWFDMDDDEGSDDFMFLEENPFSFDDLDSAEEQAQELLYEAFASIGAKRYRLAEQSLEICPMADAYTILAEKEKSPEKKLAMYQNALELGLEELGGPKFFMKHKGHFWGLIETRPYMRAKLEMANTLRELGEINETINHYQEMLELNETDNLGVRYLLFPLLVEIKKWKVAKQLLNHYKEETSTHLYNELLLEMLENGESDHAKKLMKKAQKANPFILEYLMGNMKVPKKQPTSYSMGDKNEAIIYLQSHQHLWPRGT
ncbi:SEC-C metal-binding domain-containing protein [Falsibacillus pallidus]|uniref:SEC-C metal-binding domain-containing protein n=1 Tax=Falsibacillus pallidus TaxID=493781 RepID=UPI003D9529A7